MLSCSFAKVLPRSVAEPTTTTASSQKKRRLAPFTGSNNNAPTVEPAELYDSHSLSAHARSSPTSSSPYNALSDAPSPASSETTRHTTPPRFLPPHLHEEVQLSREISGGSQQQATEGSSPSNALAEIVIDSGSSADMSGSENGGASGNGEQRAVVSPGRILGARSASPAKRTAADMEGSSGDVTMGDASMSQLQNGSSEQDQAMQDTDPMNQAIDTQETTVSSLSASEPGITSGQSSAATSFQSDAPPPYSAQDNSLKIDPTLNYSTHDIDQQEAAVMQKMSREPEQGEKGIVVSKKWLGRVLSRSTQGLKSSEYPKEAREGPLGPLDNSDIILDDAFTEPILYDVNNYPYIPLKPGLTMGQDFEVFNRDAWGVVAAHYGLQKGQKQIDRYALDTAGENAAARNVLYENYPPIFTIRKVPQPKQEDDEERPASAKTNVQKQWLLAEQRKRGQMSPDDAIMLVSSRHEKFQKFLARAKEAAGIPRSSKVRIFKILDPSAVTVDTQPDGAAAAAADTSRTSPLSHNNLAVSLEEFSKMEIGKDLEPLDAKDQTNDPNYNGTSNMELYILTESATLLLEEQIGGPAGGDFNSDRKSGFQKFKLSNLKKNSSSQPASTTNSRGTSPAPGAGIMTRGRLRRDGRTKGTVGLNNLGNTCYMNSALQCIRSCEELAIYFLSNKYKADINSSNPLGHGGAMAKQYANLLSNIYADSTGSTVSPQVFKKTLGNFAPMFSGWGQQDSQEFLSFLVDALHEDLNRILKKPYNENPDSTDETVKDPQKIIELGDTYRNNHRARNDSVAMDLFNGFYKNTMECPKCDKISITFDPFSLLTVQLPTEGSFQHSVTFVPLRTTPVNHAIDCDKSWTIKALLEHIASKHRGVDVDRLWMMEVYNHKIYKVFEKSITLGEAGIIANDHLFVFELDRAPSNPAVASKRVMTYSYSKSLDDSVPEMDDPKADCFAVPVFSRQKNRTGSGWDIILHPMYVTLTREEAQNYEIILRKVLIATSRMTSRPILTEMSEDVGDESAPEDVMDTGNNERTVNGTAQGDGLVTDTSGSEDGYVNVSLANGETAQTNGISHATKTDTRRVPERFMDQDYFISPALRNHLFTLNFAPSADGNLHCTGMSSIKDSSARNMFDRVKKPSRRNSMQSTSSEESGTTTGSGAADNEPDDENGDADFDGDEPDMVIGGEASQAAGDDEDSDLPENPLQPTSRKGRRNMNKGRKKNGKRRGKQLTYGKKDRQQNGLGGKWRQQDNGKPYDEENPYYIKLGEAIVLDWTPDALNSLFNGNPQDEEEMRGHFVSSADGKGIPFIPDPELEEKQRNRELRKKHGITIDDCFHETGKREVLSEDNAWYCNRCKELRRATKTLEIWTLPDILVVHMKRFGGNRSFRDKIDTLVDYPIEGLDMTDRVGLKEPGKEYVYDLFAVDNHFGGLGGGHYTAYAKNFYDGLWYDYNDTHCSRITESRAKSSAAAYLLFYRRRSANPLGPQYLQDLVNDFRNPTPGNGDGANDDAGEESDSGEGRLGGPNGFLRGPSSAGTGAGVAGNGMGSLRSGAGSGLAGVGTQVGSSPMMTSTTSGEHAMGEVGGRPVYGPQRPPSYGNQGVSWGFDALGSDAGGIEVDGGVHTLVRSVEDAHDNDLAGDNDDDAASTEVIRDTDDLMYEDASSRQLSAGQNSPAENWNDFDDEFQDDHTMYTGGRGGEGQDAGIDALHLEDAGMTGSASYVESDDEMLPMDASAPTPPLSSSHEKLD